MTSIALTYEGEIFIWGPSPVGDLLEPLRLDDIKENIIEASVGEESIALISENGYVWTMGNNAWGELGTGDRKLKEKPSKIATMKNNPAQAVSCGADFMIAYDNSMLRPELINEDYPDLPMSSSHKEIITEESPG